MGRSHGRQRFYVLKTLIQLTKEWEAMHFAVFDARYAMHKRGLCRHAVLCYAICTPTLAMNWTRNLAEFIELYRKLSTMHSIWRGSKSRRPYITFFRVKSWWWKAVPSYAWFPSICKGFRNVTHRMQCKRFPLDINAPKKVGKARACGSEIFVELQVHKCRRRAGGIAVRCVALRRVTDFFT